MDLMFLHRIVVYEDGLGLGLALRLLRRGGRVSVLDLRVTDAARLQLDEAAAGSGGAWQFLEENIADAARVTAAAADAHEAWVAPQVATTQASLLLNHVESNGVRRGQKGGGRGRTRG